MKRLLLVLLIAPLLPGQSYLLVNGADQSVARYAVKADMARDFDCTRGDLAFQETISFDRATRIPMSTFLMLAPQVTFAGGTNGGGSVGGGGSVVGSASFTSTAAEACNRGSAMEFPSIADDINGDATAWRCYAPVTTATSK